MLKLSKVILIISSYRWITPVLSLSLPSKGKSVASSHENPPSQPSSTSCCSSRRNILQKTATKAASTLLVSSSINPSSASALNGKDRTAGYAVQHTDREWAYILSGTQYNILRQGGTERPNSSILESEDRDGTFKCAGCNTPLFDSSQKFHSGTGWPSFAKGIELNVEIEAINPVQANLLGAEIRCATCGGHLGDIFSDGYLYVGSPAFVSGKRYCVDGAALIFEPKEGGEPVYGDVAPKRKESGAGPDWLAPPKITSRERA
jgi:peptide-methionine (R)-S-oxide reductase